MLSRSLRQLPSRIAARPGSLQSKIPPGARLISSRSSPLSRTSGVRYNALVSNTRPSLKSQLPSVISIQAFARFKSSDSTSHSFSETIGETTGFIKPDVAEVLPDELPGLTIPPDAAGYFHDLGLDFGWGTTSMAGWLIETLHVSAGLPWWLSIVGAAALARLAIAKLLWISYDNGQRMKAMRPQVDEARKRLMAAMATKDQSKIAEAKAEQTELFTTLGFNPFKSLLGLVQVPIGFGFWRFITNGSALPVPDWLHSSGLFFGDLISPDPTHILPIAFATFSGLLLRLGAKEMKISQKWKNGLMVGLPLFTLLIFWNASAALTLYFTTTTAMSFALTSILYVPGLRSAVGVTPLPPPIQNVAPAPPRVKLSESLEMMQQYKAGKPITANVVEPPKTSLEGMVASAKESYKETIQKARSKMAERDQTPPGQRRTNAQQKAAEKYEEKRRAEEIARKRMERSGRL